MFQRNPIKCLLNYFGRQARAVVPPSASQSGVVAVQWFKNLTSIACLALKGWTSVPSLRDYTAAAANGVIFF